MENMINVPLHEYEELIRDSEKLRVITERAVRTRGHSIDISFVLLIAGYQIPEQKPVAPAQKICPHKMDSVPSVPLSISDTLKESFIDGAFPEQIARELKKQIREKNR